MDARTEMHSRPGQFFDDDGFVGEGPAGSAVVFRQFGKQQAGRARRVPGFGIGAVLLAPARLVGHEFILNKMGDGIAIQTQLVRHPQGLGGKARHGGIPGSTKIFRSIS